MTFKIIASTDQFGKKVEVYHGANCVGLHGSAVLTPTEARQLADLLHQQADAAEAARDAMPDGET